MKLLSPAGNFESLKMAVYNGADEVYLGVNDFNARNNIDGFTLETLKLAVDFAHVFGVKVLLAVNILFNDYEFKNALSLVINAFNLGVDAFIIQDLGLIKILHKNYPEVEIHASTQMGLHNLEGVKEVIKYGVERVVLARETPLSEIKRIRENTDVEIEYFVQGALCVSFSGNCYMSSYLFGASGNRGKCKQPCRLPYTLYKRGKKIKQGYLLSAKDFNLSKRLKDLKDAGVDVLKIEGRARRPFYVATATKEYYKALHGESADQTALELAFNRTYTEGYFNGNGKIISDIQGHAGIFVGKVEKVVKGRTFSEVFFHSNRELAPKSTFKLFDGDKEKTTLTAFDLKLVGNNSDKKYRLTTTHDVKVGYVIRLISDAKREEEEKKQIKKRAVSIDLSFVKGERACAKIILDSGVLTVYGEVLEQAKSQPLTQEEIKKNFSKHDVLSADLSISRLDDVFISKTELNEFRRNVFTTAFSALIDSKRQILEIKDLPQESVVKPLNDFCFTIDIDAPLTHENVIYSPEIYDISLVRKLKARCEKENKTLFLDTPNFALKRDVEMLKEIVDTLNIGVVANNYYALSLSDKVVIGGGLNVYNNHTASAFNKPYLSAEWDTAGKINLPYMTLRHCPIKSHDNGSCDKCTYANEYEYVLESGKRFKLKRKKMSDCTFYLTD